MIFDQFFVRINMVALSIDISILLLLLGDVILWRDVVDSKF